MSRARLAATWLLLAGSAWCHPEIEAALQHLNPLIAAAPDDARLLLRRGELYARHEDWIAAEANLLRAAELDPGCPGLARTRGALALSRRHYREALDHLSAAVAAQPGDAEALILRARVHRALGHPAAARADLGRALALVAEPRPELYLEFAALQPSAPAAIATLDAAIARIGPALTLHLRALELEEGAGLIAAALARLETLATLSERRELWLKRRGDLLAHAGRFAESRAAYAAALAAIRALPDWLRQSEDTAQLAAELQHSLSRTSS